MAELKTYKQKVADILKEKPKTRDSDGLLYAHYIYRFHRSVVHTEENGTPYIRLADLSNLPPSETIRRCRQIIQNIDNLYLPTSEAVRKARQIKEENYREAEVREANKTQVL